MLLEQKAGFVVDERLFVKSKILGMFVSLPTEFVMDVKRGACQPQVDESHDCTKADAHSPPGNEEEEELEEEAADG